MLHDILLDLVHRHGQQVLTNPYLCGMADDMQAFQTWKERPYRLVLRGLIGQDLINRLIALGPQGQEQLQTLADGFVQSDYAQENAISPETVTYVLRCICYAAGWCESAEVAAIEQQASGQLANPEVKLGEQVVAYQPHAEAKEIGTMIPANMAAPVNRNLNRIAIEEGEIAEFVAYELQMDSEEVKAVLAAEQIDGVAMAIRQLQVGQGFILSDATGIGKGRQLAALLYWSILQGTVPVFVTEKSALFSDLYRDIKDIGHAELRPFILNSDREAKVIDAEGRCVVNLPSQQELDFFRTQHQLPEGYDFLALTYSQMSRNEAVNWKLPCVLEMVKDSYLILDESHNATGTDSNQGRFFMQAVKEACGVVFASATYAKNCATMPLYALKTAMAESNIGASELIDIVGSGGIILQEELAKGLVASGSMIRRERDMSDIERQLVYETDQNRVAQMRQAYDCVIDVVQDLQEFEQKFVMPYLKSIDIDEQLHKTLNLPDTEVFDSKSMHVDRESFAQRLMPTIQQLLLATKTELAVQTTLAQLQAGRKPVVEIQRTLESQLDFLVDVGGSLASFEFSQILRRNLMAMFHYRLEATGHRPKGKKSSAPKYVGNYSFTLSNLVAHAGNDEPAAAYQYILGRIQKALTGLPLSPIDYFIFRIEQHGYKVAEMTQRKSRIDYRGGQGPYTRIRRKSQDKKEIARQFNEGGIDVLIANRMAATGISLHASEKFQDQRQRVLISLEEQASADLSEQFQGRIDRTGQVVRGAYIKLSSPIAAERRFMMMQEHKMRSLSSIVRADQRNVIDLGVVDILNEYGSRVVDEYLRDHTELFDLMCDLREQRPSARQDVTLVSRFMRSLALLRSDEQEKVLNEVESRYCALVEELNETGENELEATVLPIEAKLKNRVVFAAGNPNSQSLFGKPAYLETVEAKILRKPMTAEEVQHLSRQLMEPQRVIEMCLEAEKEKIKALRIRYQTLRQEALAKLAEIESQPQAHHYTPSRIKQLYESANNSEKQRQQEQKVKQDFREMRLLINSFKKRQAVGVPMSLIAGEITESKLIDYISQGLFLGVRLTGPNVTRSAIKLVFAVTDGRRRIELPLTQEEQIQTIKKQTELSIMKPRLKDVNFKTWDSLLPKEARETLYIITGNILLGIWKAGQFGKSINDSRMRRFANAKGKGHLVVYTDAMGRVKHGFLMPRIFRPADIMTYGN